MINHPERKYTKRTSFFDKGQDPGLHRPGKSGREVFQMMAIGIRTTRNNNCSLKKNGKV